MNRPTTPGDALTAEARRLAAEDRNPTWARARRLAEATAQRAADLRDVLSDLHAAGHVDAQTLHREATKHADTLDVHADHVEAAASRAGEVAEARRWKALALVLRDDLDDLNDAFRAAREAADLDAALYADMFRAVLIACQCYAAQRQDARSAPVAARRAVALLACQFTAQQEPPPAVLDDLRRFGDDVADSFEALAVLVRSTAPPNPEPTEETP